MSNNAIANITITATIPIKAAYEYPPFLIYFSAYIFINFKILQSQDH
jgi:hypothetical protein